MATGRHRLVAFAVTYPRLVIVLALAITVGLALAIPGAQIDTDPENMLEADEPVRLAHARMKEEFNLADYLVIGFVDSLPVMTPEVATRMAGLVSALEQWEGVVADDILAPSTVDDIYRTADGKLVVAPLAASRRDQSGPEPDFATKVNQNPILAGKLASADGRAVAIYVPLAEKKHARQVALQVEDHIARTGGFPPHHITGLPVAEETFGHEMFVQMGISAPVAGLLILLLLLFFFRKLSVVLAPMIVAVMTVIWTLGLLVLGGFTVHIMSSMIAIFLMPIAVLDSIHILSEFHDRYRQAPSRRHALVATMDELFRPMLFTSLTTMAGFASLVFAPIPPVRVFGAFVAIGVGAAWLLSVTFNPAYAMLLSERRLAQFGARDDARSPLARWLPALGRWVIRARRYLLAVAAVAVAVAIVGIARIRVNDNPTRWFKPSHPIRVAERALGRHLAGTYMAYLEFNASQPGGAQAPEVLRYMEALQARLQTLPVVGATTGVTDIVKKVRFELFDGDSSRYAIPDLAEEIAQELFLYEIAGGDPDDLYKFITPDGSKAVLWLQLNDGDNQAVMEVVRATEAFQRAQAPPAGVAFTWGGLTYINVIWQEKMVRGMLHALLGSFLVVLIMMVFLLRSFSLGLVSMVPLSFTIALVYGAVGLSGKYYDMPIAVLSALTLGLSIDFAIHFLGRGQDLFARFQSLAGTLHALFGEPARAIARNIVVIALGFVPLLFSALIPYVTVGAFFLAIMLLSGLATLVILPALLHLRGPGAFLRWREPLPSTAAIPPEPVKEP